MIENYVPNKGDRILFTCKETLWPTIYENGVTGEVKSWGEELCVISDRGSRKLFSDIEVIQVLYRNVPPRPEPEPFIRSDGHAMTVRRIRGTGRQINSFWYSTSGWMALTAEDAEGYSRMWKEIAEQIRWDIEYGDN